MLRRKFIGYGSSLAVASLFSPDLLANSVNELINRNIPSTGEAIPVIGMGSWLTFDVGGSSDGRRRMTKVLEAFVKHGGRVVDSSPMYGSSEEVIGDLAKSLGVIDKLWIATKVWTNGSKVAWIKFKIQISTSTIRSRSTKSTILEICKNTIIHFGS